MNPFWSRIARELSPYVPGEQPRIANLVKLKTNESPFGPSPLALEAMRNAATDTLRLYPDPEATELREVLAAHHSVKPEQVFVVQRHSLAGEAEQLRPHGIKAVGDVRKQQRLRLFQERDESVREHSSEPLPTNTCSGFTL